MTKLANEAPSNNYVYLISLVAAVGGFLFGYDIAIISGAIIFMKEDFQLTDAGLGFVMSSAQIGCIFGAMVGGALSDRFGRKPILFFSAFLFGISALYTAIATSIEVFNIFRIVGGLGVGLASIVSPMYIAEVSPSRIRGRLVTINQFAICVGLLSANVASYFMSFGLGWRWMLGSEGLPVALFLGGLFLIPESPRWLIKRDKHSQALKVLTRINGKHDAEIESNEIRQSIDAESGKVSELFQKGIRMALLIAVLLAFFQQWSGAQPLLLYAPMIFQSAGFVNASDAILQSSILAGWLVISTIFALWIVERAGRRTLLIAGAICMAVGMLCTSLFFYMQLNPIYLLFMMFLSIGAYSVSLAPLTWLIMAEIFPTRLRGVAMSIASVVLWVSTVMVNQAFPALSTFSQRLFGSEMGIFIIYAVSCVATALFVYFYLPETKGKTLEQISAFWLKKSSHSPNIENKTTIAVPDETVQTKQTI